MLTAAAIAARFPGEPRRRQLAGEFDYRPPGGESLMDVAARLSALLAEVGDRYAGRRVLVVAHDAVVLMLRHLLDGLSAADLADVVRDGPVANASVTRWARTGERLALVEYNAVSHLDRAPT
jgi:broad specificity phosphatase PhoE